MQSPTKPKRAAKAKAQPRRADFEIAGTTVPAGTRTTLDIPVSVLSNHTPVPLSVHIIHGKVDGPTMFVCAAVHGDEIQGVEIVRRLVQSPALRSVKGTMLLVPIVNAFGFINHSRYLPDRRDLNRSFPGSERGSLAGQLANLFFTEIVERSDFGIDLHSAAANRTNLPQIRVSAKSPAAMEMARLLGAPIILESPLREGSMRQAAEEAGTPIIVYESGEGLRFDEFSIRVGVKGILRILKDRGMISGGSVKSETRPSAYSKSSTWVRANDGGLFRAFKTIGATVKKGDVIGAISDPFGEIEVEVEAPRDGLIIGRTNLPIVNQGDALMHIASVAQLKKATGVIEALEQDVEGDPLFDEDEIL